MATPSLWQTAAGVETCLSNANDYHTRGINWQSSISFAKGLPMFTSNAVDRLERFRAGESALSVDRLSLLPLDLQAF